jgi:hypothetical protein
MNVIGTEAAQFPEAIHKWDFLCSVQTTSLQHFMYKVHNITLPQITENQKEFPRGKIVDALKEAKEHSVPARPIGRNGSAFF